LVVVGGGPAGYVAALHAAQKGAAVALVEEKRVGGTCLNSGCIPTKALLAGAELWLRIKNASDFGIEVKDVTFDYGKAVERKDRVVQRLVDGVERLLRGRRVELVLGRASSVAGGKVEVSLRDGGQCTLEAKNILLATGSRPVKPPIPGVEQAGVITSEEALDLTEPPSRAVIIGGGVIGLEMASLFGALGSTVTVVEMLSQVLQGMDAEMVRRLRPSLRRLGIELVTGAVVDCIEERDGGKVVQYKKGQQTLEVAADLVLVAAGRAPDFGGLNLEEAGVQYDPRHGIRVDRGMRTSAPGIFAAGDVVGGPLLAHVASAEALVAVENALGGDEEMDYRAVPACVYTLPELAGVGDTEEEARAKGLNPVVSKFAFSANGRAVAGGETEGLVKIISAGVDGPVLGVHILGAHGTELIHEGALAVNLGLKARDLARTIHAHPTRAEALMEAAHGVLGEPIHMLKG